VIGTIEESARAGTVRATGGGITVLVVFVAANVYWRRHRRRVLVAAASVAPAATAASVPTSVPAPALDGVLATEVPRAAGSVAASPGPPRAVTRASGRPPVRSVPVTPGSGRGPRLALLVVAAAAGIVMLVAAAVILGRRRRHRPR
jgi:hypothetical protein